MKHVDPKTLVEVGPDLKTLGEIADMLETKIPDNALQMFVWSDTGACGTVACAIGWAIHWKLLPDLVLRSVSAIDGTQAPMSRISGRVAFAAVAEVLRIEEDQAEHLFAWRPRSAAANKRIHVIKRIRAFIQDRQP